MACSHWQAIWLLAQGLPSAPMAAVTGYTVNWIRAITRHYNQRGPRGWRTAATVMLGPQDCYPSRSAPRLLPPFSSLQPMEVSGWGPKRRPR
jgi:hypothetical protein